jgi:hypothetical protein
VIRRTSSNTPLSSFPNDLPPDSPVLIADVEGNGRVSLEPVFVVWIPLYLVLALSFSDLNFQEQEIPPPTFECELFPPNSIKEERDKQLRKISRDSIQTTCSDESFTESHSYKDSSISPQIALLKVNLPTNQ